jgi:NADH-quinone oxidoreductase subunit D
MATPTSTTASGLQSQLMTLNLGPQHPSTHGVLRVVVTLDGEEVVDAQPDIGYLHRNFEKIVEAWALPGVVPFSDRNDYLAAIANEVCVCEAIETLGEVELPDRAKWLRVLFCELQRIISHELWYGAFGMDLGAFTPFLYGFRDRETGYLLMEKATGARMLYAYNRVGGLRNDVSDAWLKELEAYLDFMEKEAWPEYMKLLVENEIFLVRTVGTGKITKEQAIAWGASGPVLRSTGLKWDLRKVRPYLVYDQVDFDVPTGTNGDNYDRAMVRMLEIRESIKIIRQVLKRLPDGPVLGKARPSVRPRVGDYYARQESPRGEIGVYLVSNGRPNAYRLKWRAPTFSHLQMIPMLSKGTKVQDLIATLGSLDVVMGEVDR